MKRSTVLACSLSAFFMAAPAYATDYYVSSTGNNNGPGTIAQPWQTIAQVNSTVFVPGDRIFFAGGETFSGTIYLDASDSGTATNPIVIGSYGTGRATISGGNNAGFYAFNTAGIDIKDLIFTGPGASLSSAGGITFYTNLSGGVKLNRININNVDVSGFSNGVAIGSWNGSTGYSNVSVTNSLLHDNAKAGLTTYAFTNVTNAHQNVYVGDVDAYNQTGIAGHADPTGSGIVLGGVDGGVIERCAAWNNGALNTNSAGPVGIWTYNSNNIVIQYNESYLNQTSGGDGGGFDIDGGVTNSVIQYNYSHDNDGAGYLFAQYAGAPAFSNNVIRYNISQNDGRKGGYDGGINVWGHSNTYKVANSQIHDNTVIMDPAPAGGALKGIYLFGTYSGLTVSNNTFLVSGGVKLIQADGNPTTANALFQCNEYFPTGDDADPSSAVLIRWGSTNYTSVSAFMAGQSGQELCSE
jgi:hypothetical protein